MSSSNYYTSSRERENQEHYYSTSKVKGNSKNVSSDLLTRRAHTIDTTCTSDYSCYLDDTKRVKTQTFENLNMVNNFWPKPYDNDNFSASLDLSLCSKSCDSSSLNSPTKRLPIKGQSQKISDHLSKKTLKNHQKSYKEPSDFHHAKVNYKKYNNETKNSGKLELLGERYHKVPSLASGEIDSRSYVKKKYLATPMHSTRHKSRKHCHIENELLSKFCRLKTKDIEEKSRRDLGSNLWETIPLHEKVRQYLYHSHKQQDNSLSHADNLEMSASSSSMQPNKKYEPYIIKPTAETRTVNPKHDRINDVDELDSRDMRNERRNLKQYLVHCATHKIKNLRKKISMERDKKLSFMEYLGSRKKVLHTKCDSITALQKHEFEGVKKLLKIIKQLDTVINNIEGVIEDHVNLQDLLY